jgi:hypothetical protein
MTTGSKRTTVIVGKKSKNGLCNISVDGVKHKKCIVVGWEVHSDYHQLRYLGAKTIYALRGLPQTKLSFKTEGGANVTIEGPVKLKFRT